ncbi:unnamed protein product [Cochlearia groenlandica]
MDQAIEFQTRGKICRVHYHHLDHMKKMKVSVVITPLEYETSSQVAVTALRESLAGVNSLPFGLLMILTPLFMQIYVALKIQKSAQQFAQAALHEIEPLQAAADSDQANTKSVVRLIDDFKHAVVDFGNCCWDDNKFAEEIQTGQYRAPEVILMPGYSFSVDI